MKTYFKAKISRFGSLISLIILSALLALFSLVLPEFILSTTGRIFAILWALIAIIIFIAHVNRFNITATRTSKRPAVRYPSNKSEKVKKVMRG